MVTMFEDSVFAAIRARTRRYLLKGVVQEETLRAIRTVGNGEAIFGPAVAARLVHYFASARPSATSGPVQFFPELTDREYEILTLVAQRKSSADTPAHIVLSPKTVCNHVSNILSKPQGCRPGRGDVRSVDGGIGTGRRRAHTYRSVMRLQLLHSLFLVSFILPPTLRLVNEVGRQRGVVRFKSQNVFSIPSFLHLLLGPLPASQTCRARQRFLALRQPRLDAANRREAVILRLRRDMDAND